ncbi:hypothetical protein NPIL_337421 [Nephila pilipes]|uniref:Uncharacterized protein n=1 Tax=Nephila pilipes TaxID=299642 RepID=A0A8X6PVR5_NEPPI|nr:hypothetical protein NPIL_337421 [Nephila pilipes]
MITAAGGDKHCHLHCSVIKPTEKYFPKAFGIIWKKSRTSNKQTKVLLKTFLFYITTLPEQMLHDADCRELPVQPQMFLDDS